MDAPLVWPLTDFGEVVLRLRPGGIGGCSSVTIRNRAAMGARAKYGGCPTSISITVQPTLQISHFASEKGFLVITSGAI